MGQPGSLDDDRPGEGNGLREDITTIAFEQHIWWMRAVPFARPRFDGRSKRVFSPAKYENFKRSLQLTVKKRHAPYEHPCAVEIVFGQGPPGKKPKWRWASFLEGAWLHTSLPDVDNLAKSILDAMNGVIWKDDAQVFRLTAEKTYSEKEFIRLSVYWKKQAEKDDR